MDFKLGYACKVFLLMHISWTTIVADNRYRCNGQCDVVLERCSCQVGCLEKNTCCSDYQVSTKLQLFIFDKNVRYNCCTTTYVSGQTAWVETECPNSEELRCPQGFESPPVILFSVDGFKAEYIYRGITPNVWKLASCGVHAPYMRPVYPTITFPSHYSIATGLYPESHGVIENSMYDYERNMEFYLGSPNGFQPFWWGGEPIWVTTSNQNKKSATYFWPGSDVNITRYPDYYHTYNGTITNEERIYSVLEWLDLPPAERPSFIALYVSSLDHQGHGTGPISPEVDDELIVVDGIIAMLMNGLKLRGLDNCVNLILLTDHGMAPQSCERLNYIDKYGVDMDLVDFYGGALGRIGKSRNESLRPQFDAKAVVNQLKCTQSESHWKAYRKTKDFPKRFHYANNDRIGEVQLVMDDTWLVGGKTGTTTFCDGGMHGYDNELESMHSLFVAHGPGFKQKFNATEPFESIEVYNLLTDLLSLNPAPNNGTKGALYHIMSEHGNIPDPPLGIGAAACTLPTTPGPATDNLGCTVCQGLSETEANARLLYSVDEGNAWDAVNEPYGGPIVYLEELPETYHCSFSQRDYSNQYNMQRHLSVYVSFTLKEESTNISAPSGCSRADFRINNSSQTRCSSYDAQDTLQSSFLYPPELSSGEAVHDALIMSNSVPMYPATKQIWNYMTNQLSQWAGAYYGVSVAAGPIFDYNYDGIVDTNETLHSYGDFIGGDTPIPTHIFLVVTRCKELGITIDKCQTSPDQVEVLSFIIPNYKDDPCGVCEEPSKWVPANLQQHVARVRDIELLAGLHFFPKWSYFTHTTQEERIGALALKLYLPQFTSQWMEDFLSGTETTAPPITTTSGCGVSAAGLGKLLVAALIMLHFAHNLTKVLFTIV